MHCHPEGDIHPPPPVPPFLLAQNLSSKQIAPTDNMWPNWCHTKKNINGTYCSLAKDSLVPRPQKGPGIYCLRMRRHPTFCGASETTVIWSVFHDGTLLKHAGRYIVVENDGGQFQENCVWTSHVVRPQ